MRITVTGAEITEQEKQNYIDYVQGKEPNRKIDFIEIEIDGEHVNLQYKFEEVPFQRTRRITGYLTGTLDKWNSAKRAEERDRVKHDMEMCLEDLT